MATDVIAWDSQSERVGVDVVDIAVFDRQLRRAGARLCERYFTAAERAFCGHDADRLAATFAGKEAVAKVLGTGIRAGVRWTDIEILREPRGRPYVRLSGGADARAAAEGIDKLQISLAHEGPFAAAVACGRGRR